MKLQFKDKRNARPESIKGNSIKEKKTQNSELPTYSRK